MPWEHCGVRLLDDVAACPTCGVGKRAWTTLIDETRLLVVGKGWSGDAAAQVLTLTEASARGVPFCARCEAMRRSGA